MARSQPPVSVDTDPVLRDALIAIYGGSPRPDEFVDIGSGRLGGDHVDPEGEAPADATASA